MKPHLSPDAAKLRQGAEARLKEQHPQTCVGRIDADTQRLVHELQVHQIELEMQNEELQRARDEMEAGLERYSDLYDFAPVGYLTLDRESVIREANLSSASLVGVERSRFVKRRFRDYVSPADQPAFRAFLTKTFESQFRESCEVTLLGEGKRPVEVRIEAEAAASGPECRAVLQDITGRKRAEEDRLILNKLESTGILAGGLAHDFNNLFAVILMNLELAQEALSSEKESTQYLKEAKNAVMTAGGLAKRLITFASGDSPMRKLTVLSGMIQESVRSALSGSRVQCDFLLAHDLWPADVDEGQIGQVIRNMILNAREAMPEGGMVYVKAENVVLRSDENPSLPPGDYVRVSIVDQGAGIPKEVLPKIFDPYFSTKQRGIQKGMGLGLTICHTIVQKHRGSIVVESKERVGITFHVYLPAARKLLGEEKTLAPTTQRRHARILVMDDENALKKVLKASLQRMGHEVELVGDGRQAVEAYENAKKKEQPFEAVMMDLTIPGGMGGKETMQALLKIDPTVKAIVMSGYADDPVLREPERYGFKGALTKPFNLGELNQILSRLTEA